LSFSLFGPTVKIEGFGNDAVLGLQTLMTAETAEKRARKKTTGYDLDSLPPIDWAVITRFVWNVDE
jgi:hypothetical protein